MLSGTHRCNSLTHSSCDGTTSICSKTDMSEVYPIFDNYFAQLHGFSKRDTDPFVIMSSGTRETPIPDYLSALSIALFDVDNTLSFKIAHIDIRWTRLIGFTNTQGRYINSSVNACEDNATMTNGRFMHLEQEKFKWRNDSSGWHKMAMALDATFSEMECGTVAALIPLKWLQFLAKAEEEKVILEWSTLSEKNNAYFEIE